MVGSVVGDHGGAAISFVNGPVRQARARRSANRVRNRMSDGRTSALDAYGALSKAPGRRRRMNWTAVSGRDRGTRDDRLVSPHGKVGRILFRRE